MFDPKLTKKKKKKKTGFDLDAAMDPDAGSLSNDVNDDPKSDKENIDVDTAPAEDEEALDLENFGKKKRKKKKFNLDELEAALPDAGKKEVRFQVISLFIYIYFFLLLN